ncbi:MAG: cell division protein ZipA C-terminal FtsZ-binding domain-containing protein, partial [Ostreibacterium sp.]
IAFSVINACSPNTFHPNPERMRPTNGLIAIMQLPVADGDHQAEYFHLLLSILDELRTNLDADLCDIKRNLIKNKKLYEMQKDIESFEQSCVALIQNDYQRHHT